MTSHCDSVAERVAVGEPLGELADHVAGCERCKLVVEMPGKLGATRHDIDPGLGFSARMTMGAQQRIAVRRKRRLAAGLAASVAAGAMGVVVMARSPAEQVAKPETEVSNPPDPAPEELPDEQLANLVDIADTGRTMRMSGDWKRIEKRLSPYRKLSAAIEEVPTEEPPTEGDPE
jgi:hypothetical protein